MLKALHSNFLHFNFFLMNHFIGLFSFKNEIKLDLAGKLNTFSACLKKIIVQNVNHI